MMIDGSSVKLKKREPPTISIAAQLPNIGDVLILLEVHLAEKVVE